MWRKDDGFGSYIYPGQSISKCWSCGYEENRRHYEEGKCKETFPRLSEVQKVQIEFT